MIKYKGIIFTVIILTFTSCNKNNNPISPGKERKSIEGLWQESYYGYPLSEYVLIPDSEDQFNLIKPDSIRKTSTLTLDKNQFTVRIIGNYFLNGEAILSDSNNSEGKYEINNDSTLTFTASYKLSEEYIYKLESNIIYLMYIPVIQSGYSVSLISSDIGIPWGNSWKHSGTFTKTE
jgi:hypothetical protein